MHLGYKPCDARYVSPTQRARICTEQWVKSYAYCPNCGGARLGQYPNNQPVADFFCSQCSEQFELKSSKTKFGTRVTDGAYDSMCRRLAANDNPNLMLLNYNVLTQTVANFLVVPKCCFVRSMIEPRKPLSLSARRAGWIGCNINLNAIPAAGKICIVADGTELPKKEVLAKWKQTEFLRRRSTEGRGWLLEVMKCVDSLQRADFTIEDVYAFAPELSRLYPGNKHVRQKIRQQLQVLRDNHYLEFTVRGRYRLTRTDKLDHLN